MTDEEPPENDSILTTETTQITIPTTKKAKLVNMAVLIYNILFVA